MYALNDILIMKKPHACGGDTWVVARVGADIKLQCQTCKRYKNFTRDELKKATKSRGKENLGE